MKCQGVSIWIVAFGVIDWCLACYGGWVLGGRIVRRWSR